MISKKVQGAINSQINKELYSSYLYLAMEACAQEMGLAGAANWLRCQVQEEMCHAAMFIKYLYEQNAPVKLEAIAQPPAKWKDLPAIFAETLKHEGTVTASINALAKLAMQENDFPTSAMLQWFINEQVEEEAAARDIIDKLRIAGQAGLFLIDKDLAARVFTPPAAMAGA